MQVTSDLVETCTDGAERDGELPHAFTRLFFDLAAVVKHVGELLTGGNIRGLIMKYSLDGLDGGFADVKVHGGCWYSGSGECLVGNWRPTSSDGCFMCKSDLKPGFREARVTYRSA